MPGASQQPLPPTLSTLWDTSSLTYYTILAQFKIHICLRKYFKSLSMASETVDKLILASLSGLPLKGLPIGSQTVV